MRFLSAPTGVVEAVLGADVAREGAGDGAVNYFNDAAGKLTKALGLQKPRQLLPEGFPAMIRASLISGQSQSGITSAVNGHTLSWTIQPLPAGGFAHCYGEDITTRLNLESQLLQSEKMKTFGQFAAGIAHDFNNMLTIIQGHTGKLLESETLMQQAASNSKEQFANSPDLKMALVHAIMDALDAHQTMSSQALGSERVQDGLKDILLGPAKLYEALREKAGAVL